MNIKRKYRRIARLQNEIREIHIEIEHELNLISEFLNKYIDHHSKDIDSWFKEIKKEYINHSSYKNVIIPMQFLGFLNDKEKVECLKTFIEQKQRYIGALFPEHEGSDKKHSIVPNPDPRLCAHVENLTDLKVKRMIELLINYFEQKQIEEEREKEVKIA